MYQVLVVDDEYLALDKLCSMLKWENYGFHIAGTASNGSDAIDFVNSNHVDVVFTDICMPVLNGVELAKYINAHNPDTKVVIMSSYSDFEYVKECFAANACDYILKHLLTPELLIKLLDKLSGTYLKKQSNLSMSYDEYVKAKQYRHNIIEQIRGNDSSRGINGAVVAAVKLSSHILLEFVHSSSEMQTFYRHIINTVSQILKNLNGFVIFQDSTDTVIIFMPFGDIPESEIMRILRNYIKQANYSIKKFFDLTLQWGISCVSSDEYSLNDCYKDAMHMLGDKPIVGKTENEPQDFASLSIDDEKNIISAVQALSCDRLDSVLESIFDRIPQQQLTLNIIVSELITLANKMCMEFSLDIRSLSDTLTKLNLAVNSNCSKADILVWNKTLFHSIISSINSNLSHKQKYSSMIKDYIHNHYSEDIGLKQIADSIGITETYLSTVFKEETGSTVSNYLSNFRIEKAKELLLQNVDIKFLYSAVGFKSYNYFFSTFKKVVGCTPRQYKNIAARNSK